MESSRLSYLVEKLNINYFCIFLLYFAFIFSVSAEDDIQKCRISGYSYEIECGYFSYQNFEVHWYKVAARVRYPAPDPLVWISDTLSISSKERASGVISNLSRMRNNRDLIWIEIRGKGNTDPIGCIDETILPLNERLNRFDNNQTLDSCWNKIKLIDGLRIFSYQSVASIYEKLRTNLKLKQVIVLAEGQAANVVKAWSNITDTAIRYQILDSPTFTDFDNTIYARSGRMAETLLKLSSLCLANIRCKAKFGNLYHSTQLLVKQLPVKTHLSDPLNGKSVELEVNSVLFAQFITYMLKNPTRSRLLPMLIFEARNNNWQPMIGVLGMNWSYNKSNMDFGPSIIEQCAHFSISENESKEGLDFVGQWFYNSEMTRLDKLCKYSKIRQVKLSSSPITFRVPTLILSGGLNPAKLSIKKATDKVLHITAPGAGAGVLSYGCSRDIVYRFVSQLDSGDFHLDSAKLEADCLTKIPYPSMNLITVEQLP